MVAARNAMGRTRVGEKVPVLIESVPDAVVLVNRQGAIVAVNARAEELFGYSRTELLGRPVEMLVPPRLRERHLLHRQGYFAEPRVRPMGVGLDLYALRKDGKEVPVEISLSPLETDEGHLVGSFIRDITLRRELEAQLRQAQKMEALGRLAGGIAHDFNNVLTVITGRCILLRHRLGEAGEIDRGLEEIQEAGERAAGLTRQLLAHSRRQPLEPKVLDLNAVVGSVVPMLRRLTGESIELATVLAPDLGSVRTDPTQMEQVIMNLVVNARDAMPRGGKILIETANLDLGEDYARRHIAARPGSYVLLAVSDTGCGMTPDVQARVFEPFFTTKEKGKGTGIGLATVYGIIKQSGGNIWVYSEPGHGTTFKIYLPRLAEALDAPEPTSKTTGLEPGSETVLVVEDEAALRSLTREILEARGYTVLEAGHPEEALQICKRHEGAIDLLLTDVVMPGMSGRDLAERLTALRPRLKVLCMSGYTGDAIAHLGVLDVGVAYLQKPFTPDALVSKVREVLEAPDSPKR